MARRRFFVEEVHNHSAELVGEEARHLSQVLRVETGQTVRADCTVVESNIHHPTDSSLLWDCVRVLVRWQARAQEMFGVNFTNHKRRARRRALGVLNAKSDVQRLPLYRDLLKVSGKIVKRFKPKASRPGSSETFLAGIGLKT